jgi:hypothetical protein
MKQSQIKLLAQTGLVVSVGALVTIGATIAIGGSAAPYGAGSSLLLLLFSFVLLNRSRLAEAHESSSES